MTVHARQLARQCRERMTTEQEHTDRPGHAEPVGTRAVEPEPTEPDTVQLRRPLS